MSDYDENALLQQIMQEQSNKGTRRREYLVRGATVVCDQSVPRTSSKIRLPKDHGKFVLGRAVLSAEDRTSNNIYGFGRCSTGEICNPVIVSPWANVNENETIFDQNVLNGVGVPHTESYLVCTNKTTGRITVLDSGQPYQQRRSIPDNVEEVKEDQYKQMPNGNPWLKFTPVKSGHFNINMKGQAKPYSISVYEAGWFNKMSLVCDVEFYDYRPSQRQDCLGRIELWMDKGKTYYVTIPGTLDEIAYTIAIEGNIDQEECDSSVLGGKWYRPEGVRQPDSIGYTIMQKTFLSAEATTYLYASLYDPNLPKGIYNNNRDRIVGWGRDAFVAYLVYKFSGIFMSAKEAGKVAIVGFFLTCSANELTSSTLTDLEGDNIYEKGNFITMKNSHNQDVSVAQNGIILTSQITAGMNLSGGVISQTINTTLEAWVSNLIEGPKYFRGLITNDESILFMNIF